jgi:hypothetical protein
VAQLEADNLAVLSDKYCCSMQHTICRLATYNMLTCSIQHTRCNLQPQRLMSDRRRRTVYVVCCMVSAAWCLLHGVCFHAGGTRCRTR